MFYRCKSCGGNVTYNPDKKKMICESCGNEGEPELISQDKKHVCNNCGAEIEADPGYQHDGERRGFQGICRKGAGSSERKVCKATVSSGEFLFIFYNRVNGRTVCTILDV